MTVTDQGHGIEGIDPRRIFDRFAKAPSTAGATTTGRPGFGIGLALVRDIAARHGGSVEVAATGDHGTTLRLSLPSLPIRSGS